MSSAAIVGFVATGLFILIGIAIAMQTIEKNKKEKNRLLSGLTGRARNFDYMLAGFPEGFLNTNLQVLVCKCLLDVYEQLTRLEPKNSQHASRTRTVRQQLQQLSKKAATNKTVNLTDANQIQEVQKLLTNLFNFISKLTSSKKISNKDGLIYAKQIRRLMLQTSLDALTIARDQALKDNKPRLVTHYLEMAVEKMSKENEDGFYSTSIANYTQKIDEYNTEAAAEELKKKSTVNSEEQTKKDDSWKKKALYD